MILWKLILNFSSVTKVLIKTISRNEFSQLNELFQINAPSLAQKNDKKHNNKNETQTKSYRLKLIEIPILEIRI